MPSRQSAIVIAPALIILCTSSSFTPLDIMCPRGCQCKEQMINCTSVIPEYIPKGITEIMLCDPTRASLIPGIFCNVSWHSAKKLGISAYQDDLHLPNDVFTCLDQIESIRIYSPDNVVYVHDSSFAGLSNVSQLDLSGCSRITIEDLFTALESKRALPKLSYLDLFQVNRAYGTIKISQDLVRALGARKIVEMNLSSSAINFQITDLSPLCDTLVTLNISNAIITYESEFNHSTPCKSLKTIDMSGLQLPRSRPFPKKLTIKNLPIPTDRLATKLIQNFYTMYVSRLISSDHEISLINCTANISFENRLTEIHARGYVIRTFDVELYISPNYIKYIDISSNSIESIGGNVFKNLKLLRRLVLANNTLSRTRDFNKIFPVLFRSNSELEELDISRNGLTYLPKRTFAENTNLEYLSLSGNAFQDIGFDIAQLSNLTLLDLRDNKIQYLEKSTRDSLVHIFRKQYLTHQNENRSFVVDLRDNPLSCKCAALDFVKWFVESPIFNTTRHMYHCQIDGRQVSMDDTAISIAKDDCERPIRQRNKILMASLIPVLSIATLGIVTVTAIKRRKRRLTDKRRQDRIKLLQDKEIGFQFPIFLSYSSEDREFVHQNILGPLQHNLQLLTNTERNLVCIGDRYFRPGYSLFTEINRCLDNCAIVVAVMSRNFCKSFYCKLEIEQARLNGKPVLMVFMEDVEEDEMSEVMREIFRNFTRVRMVLEGGQYQSQPGWCAVCESVIQLI